MSFSNYKTIGAVIKEFQMTYIYELDRLFAVVNHVFQQCEIQLDELVAA